MRRLVPVALLCILPLSVARADVKLAALFSDHVVLQRDKELPIWGWAEPGEAVTVSLAGQTAQAKADQDGKWIVRLKPLTAGGPHELKVKGANEVTVNGVLVGEVWLCSGQSNMAMTVSRSNNAKEEIAGTDLPQVRMFKESSKGANEPQADAHGTWQPADPKTVGGFSATAFFFGRQLHRELKVPIGLINSSVGGTPIEAWTSLPAQQKLSERPEVSSYMKDQGHDFPPQGAASLYNGKIAPLVPFALRGAIWYQGERNRREIPYAYRWQLPAMITDWRAQFGQGDFPFAWVQLPDFQKAQTEPSQTSGWVLVREGMLEALKTPNTGMAVTIGLGMANNIHPTNKQDVGKRLALWALANTYGQKIEYNGPVYKSMQAADGRIVLEFDHAEGLKAADGTAPVGFAIAGADKKFVWAEAKIVGNTVEVSSPQVPQPVAVRYAWADNPKWSLVNSADLPASPFRTDTWKE